MGNHAAESRPPACLAAGRPAAAVENFFSGFFRQPAEGFVGIDTARQFLEQPLHGALQVRGVGAEGIGDGGEGVTDGLARIGENQLGSEVPLKAHATALRASALAAVKRKKARVERLVADAAGEAEEPLVENLFAAFGDQMNDAVAQAQPPIDHQFDFAAAGLGLADDDVDVVLFIPFEPVEQCGRSEVDRFAVDAGAAVAEAARPVDDFFVKPFAPAHDGAQDHDLFAAIATADAVEDLAARERANLPAALDAMLLADLGVEQTEIMKDLSDRRHRRVSSALAQPLFDGDGGWNAGEQINVGPRHDLEKLARISGQAVGVAPLPPGPNDIEGERRFAGAAQAGDHHEAVARDVEADVLEVMLLGADDHDRVVFDP